MHTQRELLKSNIPQSNTKFGSIESVKEKK